MIEAALVYLAGVVVLAGAFAIRTPDQDLRMVFLLSMFWPASIVLIALMFLLQAVRWDFDVAESTTRFGFRKPTNPNARGFAVTVFGTEFQFYSMRKA